MKSYLDLQKHENCTSSIPWYLLIWSLLLSSEVPPGTLLLVKFGFPLIAQVIHFWEQKILCFESIFVISWLEHHGNWDELSVMTTPFLFLTSGCGHIMPCLALGIQECDGSFCLWGEQDSVVHHLQRGEKEAKYYQFQAWDSSTWGQKAVAYMDDRFFHSCLSVAVIQGDEGGLIYMWPLVQGMISVFAGFMAHPNPPAKILA